MPHLTNAELKEICRAHGLDEPGIAQQGPTEYGPAGHISAHRVQEVAWPLKPLDA